MDERDSVGLSPSLFTESGSLTEELPLWGEGEEPPLQGGIYVLSLSWALLGFTWGVFLSIRFAAFFFFKVADKLEKLISCALRIKFVMTESQKYISRSALMFRKGLRLVTDLSS